MAAQILTEGDCARLKNVFGASLAEKIIGLIGQKDATASKKSAKLLTLTKKKK